MAVPEQLSKPWRAWFDTEHSGVEPTVKYTEPQRNRRDQRLRNG